MMDSVEYLLPGRDVMSPANSISRSIVLIWLIGIVVARASSSDVLSPVRSMSKIFFCSGDICSSVAKSAPWGWVLRFFLFQPIRFSMSSADVTSSALCSLMSLLGPLLISRDGRPGSAAIFFLYSWALSAVIREPPFSPLSTTRVKSFIPATILFLETKFTASGCVPLRNSVSIAPPFSIILFAMSLCCAGYSVSKP